MFFLKIQIWIRPDPNLQPCYTSLYLRTYHAAFQLENVYNAKDKKHGLLLLFLLYVKTKYFYIFIFRGLPFFRIHFYNIIIPEQQNLHKTSPER